MRKCVQARLLPATRVDAVLVMTYTSIKHEFSMVAAFGNVVAASASRASLFNSTISQRALRFNPFIAVLPDHHRPRFLARGGRGDHLPKRENFSHKADDGLEGWKSLHTAFKIKGL